MTAYILSLSIHQFTHTLKGHVLNSHFVPGTGPSAEDAMINMVNGPCIQLTVYWGSLTHDSFNGAMWSIMKRFPWAEGEGSTERKMLISEWVKYYTKPFRDDIGTQSCRMNLGFSGTARWRRFLAVGRACDLMNNGRWASTRIAEVRKEISLISATLYFQCVDICWWRGVQWAPLTAYAS